jgi:hypothetical protein
MMMVQKWISGAAAVLLLGLFACEDDKNTPNDTDSGSLDGDADGDGDGDADGDGDGDGDAGADSDTDSDSDTNSDPISDILIFPIGANPNDLVGDTPVQIVETDFDPSGVDFTLGGMNSDLPDPTYDCTDPMITQNCISYVVDIGTGEFFEYLWIGNEEINPGGTTGPVDGYGEFTSLQAPYFASMDIYVDRWPATPTTFSETMVQGNDPPNIYISASFSDFGGSPGSTTGTIFREARVNGWAAHTTDYEDASNTVMVAAFAGEWMGVTDDIVVRFRGTLKGYFLNMDIKK